MKITQQQLNNIIHLYSNIVTARAKNHAHDTAQSKEQIDKALTEYTLALKSLYQEEKIPQVFHTAMLQFYGIKVVGTTENSHHKATATGSTARLITQLLNDFEHDNLTLPTSNLITMTADYEDKKMHAYPMPSTTLTHAHTISRTSLFKPQASINPLNAIAAATGLAMLIASLALFVAGGPISLVIGLAIAGGLFFAAGAIIKPQTASAPALSI